MTSLSPYVYAVAVRTSMDCGGTMEHTPEMEPAELFWKQKGTGTPYRRVHRVSKTSHPFVLLELERILIFFEECYRHKVSNQTKLYYATSNNLCFCTTWQNGKHENIFHSNAV